MLNAASKCTLVAALLLGAASCSSKKESDEEARALLQQAQEAAESGDYLTAQALIDSIDSTWPKAIDVRKEAMTLRPRVIEGKTMQEIADLHAQQSYLSQYIDSLSAEFKQVNAGEDVLEPYAVHKDVPTSWRDRNTAVARVTASGDFIVISSLDGNSTHHTALRLSDAGGMSVTSGSIPFDSTDRLSRESVRFPSEKADTLGEFLLAADGRGPLTLDFVGGTRKAPSAKLSAKEVHAMANTYRLAKAIRAINANAWRLEQLSQKFQTALDQSARLEYEEE